MSTIQVTGVREALNAFRELPRRIGLKHLRIGLNAAGGVIRDRAVSLAPKETGLLKKSLGVKVKIPAASYNAGHHDKPAYAVIGPKRNFVRLVTIGRTGARTTGAKRALKLLGKGQAVRARRPARYAHLAEKHQSFINAAWRQAGEQAVSRISEKLSAGFIQEAAALPKG